MTEIEARLDALLAAPAASLPSFAADGRLYFLCDAGGSAQVWELPAGGGAPRPRSAHRDAVSFVAGSPADGGAVFGRDSAGDERVQLYRLEPEGEARPLTADPRTIHAWGAFSPDGRRVACAANSRDPAHADPVVIDIATGAATRLCEVQGPHELPGWMPDGRSVVLSTAPRTFESELIAVAPEWRGAGLGACMLELAEDYARAHGATRLCVNARGPAVGFYARSGFIPGAWDGCTACPEAVPMLKPMGGLPLASTLPVPPARRVARAA